MSVTLQSIAAGTERHGALELQAQRTRTTEQRIISLEHTVADLMVLVGDLQTELNAIKRYAPVEVA